MKIEYSYIQRMKRKTDSEKSVLYGASWSDLKTWMAEKDSFFLKTIDMTIIFIAGGQFMFCNNVFAGIISSHIAVRCL